MINPLSLARFLLEANLAGFAGGEPKKWTKEPDGSTSIVYEKGSWRQHDNFFGGEPYGGRIIVHFENKPVWMMVYYGWVKKGVAADPVYEVLKYALKDMPSHAPFRGPKTLTLKEYGYTNVWKGTVLSYSGKEKITHKNKPIYKAFYMGGLVDQKII